MVTDALWVNKRFLKGGIPYSPPPSWTSQEIMSDHIVSLLVSVTIATGDLSQKTDRRSNVHDSWSLNHIKMI